MAAAFISGTFNAFAFAGAGFLFQKLNKQGYDAEMKRHNHALENLQKARDHWNELRLKELDRLQKLHYDKSISDKDIEQTNKDFLLVHSKFDPPSLSDYYSPSHEMQEYMTFVKYLSSIPVIYGVLALL